MKYLVTGTAGFIGFHVAQQLLKRGEEVIGLDIINDYYDVDLKYKRLEIAGIDRSELAFNKPVKSTVFSGYTFVQMDLANKEVLMDIFENGKIDVVIHLAAQAGVRYSLTNPDAYIAANIQGFLNILEACRKYPLTHLVYASSSSVYGANTNMPFSTSHNVDHPVSLYAATKKSNELMAHTYSHLFQIPTTGLRFFTVYGPWGRPDMALFLFIEAMNKGEAIQVFNHGKMKRDFTFIDDIVEGIIRVADRPAKPNPDWTGQNPDPGSSYTPYKIYNIGNSNPVELMDYIGALEKAVGKVAEKNMLPLQQGDVPATFADVSDLVRDTGYKPATSVEDGVTAFVEWYNKFYNKSGE
ncbi:NAD dependent epimerase/dehydratase [Rhodonellum psychrophilum GCM71 = DSM 17998]|uniref:NAD dependent epimerase/dehydratase n=2 Tax=Rhodonellum TaxID=336827 RepID=U5C1J5_9BACT|nr:MULTISPECIES: NAD-dependent epimerase [Rhodonellum]ERM83923.1 NAD dependent epimerase/dehydratase [Rhodonellum psychrophilum GCM71 = DSM 17998]SDZ05023.1 UDP-glucuronate 4-epimerase [Rhodonellum ikkaensis]